MTPSSTPRLLSLLLVLSLLACQPPIQQANAVSPLFEVETLNDTFKTAWGLDFLPNGHLLISERSGSLKRYDPTTNTITVINNVPSVVFEGQGGLLDIRVHPEFDTNSWVYLAYSQALNKELATTRVIRATLKADTLADVDTIWEATPGFETRHHYGCALLFDTSGSLWITMGDRGRRHLAQQTDKANGKVFRLLDDGRPHPDNPDFDSQALPGLYSLGHRNPQGITLNPANGDIWAAEHGPRGGDEVNLIKPGVNYGWPVITYGEEYRGGSIGEGSHKQGMAQPLHYYVPSIATAGIEYYNGTAFPEWRDSLFVVGLRSQSLSRIQLQGHEKLKEERLLESLELRLREVRQGPDGYLYLLAENGHLLRLTPTASND